jgi:Family of unknown function (DUF5715)
MGGIVRSWWNPSCMCPTTHGEPGTQDSGRATAMRRTIGRTVKAAALPGAVVAAVVIGVAMSAAAKPSVTVRGSPASMERQHEMAVAFDYTFTASPKDVEALVARHALVPLSGGADYALASVSFPYARPEVKTFVERVSADYRKACGEPLVVTSLTRPTTRQPGNAHKLSVHPAGMAVDFRISRSSKCRDWLEKSLLEMEKKDLLDITRERTPAHYHVAVFTRQYAAYAARTRPAASAPAPPAPVAPAIVRPAERAAPSAPAPAAPAARQVRDEAPQTGGAIAAGAIALVLAAFFWTQIRRARQIF